MSAPRFSSPGSFEILWKKLAEATQKVGHIDLFCDFDGVIVPIARRPQDAVLDEEMTRLLEGLSQRPAMHVSVVSGRSLADIRVRVGVPGITYAGNHGLEIEGPGIHTTQQIPAPAQQALRSLSVQLARRLQAYPGVIVEDKTLVMTVHYRLVEPARIPHLRHEVEVLVAQYNSDQCLRMTGGKCVMEVRPNVDWNKGRAVEYLLEARHGVEWGNRTVPVYLGDDETDEDAFRVLGEDGITIHVGDQSDPTAARHHLHDVREVAAFLQRFLLSFPGA